VGLEKREKTMIKNLARNDQLSVWFIKWGKTIIYKGDCQQVAGVNAIPAPAAGRSNDFDIIVLNKWYTKIPFTLTASAFICSGFPLLMRTFFFPFPLDSVFFSRLFSRHATCVAASLGRSGR